MSIPTLDELRDLHRRVTSHAIQNLFKGMVTPYGCWLYSKDGKPGTHPLPLADLELFFSKTGDAEKVVTALSLLVRKYLAVGGPGRSAMVTQNLPLPRAIILVAPPHELSRDEVVKTFVLTEHQTFFAESPVAEDGRSVKLKDLEMVDVSLMNSRPTKNTH
jgi:hypothetical protein